MTSPPFMLFGCRICFAWSMVFSLAVFKNDSRQGSFIVSGVPCNESNVQRDVMTWKCFKYYWPFVWGIHWPYFFVVRLNKLVFETPWHPYDVTVMVYRDYTRGYAMLWFLVVISLVHSGFIWHTPQSSYTLSGTNKNILEWNAESLQWYHRSGIASQITTDCHSILCFTACLATKKLSKILTTCPAPNHYITMTSKWARWRLKSPASPLFTQPFIQGIYPRKHQSSASLAFVRRIHRWPVNSPHNGPVTRKVFPFDDVIMFQYITNSLTFSGSDRSRRWHVVLNWYAQQGLPK